MRWFAKAFASYCKEIESERLKLELLRREVRNGIEAGDKGLYATQTLDQLAAEEQADFEAGP